MNIFVVDFCPFIAAQMLCDKHVVKMVLETAQILSHVAYRYGYFSEDVYKSSYAHHPCTRWAGNRKDQWLWTCKHGLGLAQEYTHRYEKIHPAQYVIEACLDGGFGPNFGKRRATMFFAQAMPDQYKQRNAVKAYRAYYLNEKLRFAKWTNRLPPKWITTHFNWRPYENDSSDY